ncbi:hypothetical protein [Streptomyces bikiniensis]|uniref:hypothetical protein n=1 Tax=Streptomyces bikiniensis TaxID=1896 RepID=UPI00131A4CA6|nr:hypothetical protein [Streptomyces bikiniensis]
MRAEEGSVPATVPEGGAGEGGTADAEKPNWYVTGLLAAIACAVLRLGGVWSWWALLWAPLLLFAVALGAHDWRLMARHRPRLGAYERFVLVTAHLGVAVAVARIVTR